MTNDGQHLEPASPDKRSTTGRSFAAQSLGQPVDLAAVGEVDEAALASTDGAAHTLTQSDLARMLGVSRWTINRALRGDATVHADTRRRIADIAKRHRYRPSAAARAMRSRSSRQVGVLVTNSPGHRFTHPLAFEAILGINEGLQSAGYVACLARIDDVKADLRHASRVFTEHLLDGMIVLDSMPRDVEQRLEELIPNCIWADSNVWRDECCIRRDEQAAGELAARKAIELGYRRLVWLGFGGGEQVHYSHRERVAGVRQAVEATDGVELIPANGYMPGSEWMNLFDRVRRDREMVLIAETAYIAKSMLPRVTGAGLRVGHDVGLMSCDDSHEIWRHWRGLSRVRFDRFDLGRRAAAMMLERIETPGRPLPSVRMPVDWFVGNTAWGPRGDEN